MKQLFLILSVLSSLSSISILCALNPNITIDNTEYQVVQTLKIGELRFAEIKNIQDGTAYLLGGTRANPVKYPFSDMEGLDNTALDYDGLVIYNDLDNSLRNNSVAAIAVPINLALSCCGAGYISYKVYTWAKKLKEKAAIGKRYFRLIKSLKRIRRTYTPA